MTYRVYGILADRHDAPTVDDWSGLYADHTSLDSLVDAILETAWDGDGTEAMMSQTILIHQDDSPVPVACVSYTWDDEMCDRYPLVVVNRMWEGRIDRYPREFMVA